MNSTRRSVRSLVAALVVASAVHVAAPAQGPDLLLTFRQPELTLSGSAGTVLQFLRPNEIAHLSFASGCATASAEKWSPRTCFQTMAGDEDGDFDYWQPSLFGEIDALALPAPLPGLPSHNARSAFWSPATALGPAISSVPLRPGDVGRLGLFGQVEYFMSQEQFNAALGLAPSDPIDVDAIAYEVGLGVYFSLDQDTVCNTACGTMLVQDGDVIAIPDSAIQWTWDKRVFAVAPNSAVVLLTEAQLDGSVATSQITDRDGICVTTTGDLEALDVAPGGVILMQPCSSVAVILPTLVLATETMTGGGLITSWGQIWNGPCGAIGTTCGNGPTFGPQVGIKPVSSLQGAASHVNALAAATTKRFVLEPVQHQLAYAGNGGPGTTVHIGSQFTWAFTWIEIVPPTVPGSITVAPALSPHCFPDYFFPSTQLWTVSPTPNGFGSFTTPNVPAFWSGKLLFQSLAFDGADLQLSTPMVLDIS